MKLVKGETLSKLPGRPWRMVRTGSSSAIRAGLSDGGLYPRGVDSL